VPLSNPGFAERRGHHRTRVESNRFQADPRAGFGNVWGSSRRKTEGNYDTILEAAQRMARLKKATYRPNPTAQKVYDPLYAEYLTLHNYFGGGVNDVMKRLKQVKAKVRD
jgi:L-ribulokinase